MSVQFRAGPNKNPDLENLEHVLTGLGGWGALPLVAIQ